MHLRMSFDKTISSNNRIGIECAFSPLSCLVRDRRLESAAETKGVRYQPLDDVSGNLVNS